MNEYRSESKQEFFGKKIMLGTWCVLPSAATVEICAIAGLDFVIIDLEHGPMDYQTSEHMIRAAEVHGCRAFVRPPELSEQNLQRCLEIGAHGVIVPQIQSVEDACRVVDAVKYAPNGCRGHSPFARAGGYNDHDVSGRMSKSNSNIIICLLIEGVGGVRALPDILEACAGDIDVIYIGPYDLSHSAGYPGEIEHPKVLDLAKSCFEIVQQYGVISGTLASKPEDVDEKRRLGARFIAYKADSGLFFDAVQKVADLRYQRV